MSQNRAGRRPGLGQARQVIASVAVSGFGTWSYNVGIAVYAYDRTHSATWVAIVTVGRYLPALVLTWLAHSLIDRLPRRTVAMAADLGCALVMVVLAFVCWLDASLWLITVVAAVSSTLARVQAAAVMSLVADIVVESELARAARLAGAAEAVATATGAAAASLVLLRFSPQSLFLVNAVTFVVSALLIAAVRSARRTPGRADPSSSVSTGSVGVAVFWPLQAARTIAAYIYGVDIVILTVVAARQFSAGSGTGGYGWLLAATGLGGLLAVTPLRSRLSRLPTAALLTGGTLAYALPLMVFALGPPAPAGIATQIFRGAASVLVTSAAVAGLQRSVPSSMSGRVFSTTQSLVLLGTCAGAISTPLLLGLTGFNKTLVITALASSVAAAALYPFLSRFERQEASLLQALDPRLSVLRGLQLLRDASRATLYDLVDSIVEVEAEAGTALVKQGEPSDALYVLVSGAVEVTAWHPDGPALLRRLEATDYFGEIGLLRGRPRTSTVTALGQCSLWRIPAEAFLAGVAEAGESGALSDTIRVRYATQPVLQPR